MAKAKVKLTPADRKAIEKIKAKRDKLEQSKDLYEALKKALPSV